MQFVFPIITILGLAIAITSGRKKAPFFQFIGILISIYGGLKSMSLVMPPLPGQVVVMFMISAFLIQEVTKVCYP